MNKMKRENYLEMRLIREKAWKIFPFAILPIVVIIFCLITIYVGSSYDLKTLYLSSSNPSGIYTMMFVFDGIINYIVFGMVAVGLTANLILRPNKERFQRAIFLSIGMFFVAILSSYYWLMSLGAVIEITYGQSGVVFSSIGILMGYYTIDTIALIRKSNRSSIIKGIIVGAITFGAWYFFIEYPVMAFNMHQGVNYYLHEDAFQIGFLIGLLFLFIFPRTCNIIRKVYRRYFNAE